MRALMAGLGCAALLAVGAGTAAASIMSAQPPHRDTSLFTQVGITHNEGVGGIATYQWAVDRTATEAILRGFAQGDGSQTAPLKAIDCAPSDPAGEIGRDVTGIGFLPNQSKLLIADYSNDRILTYDRSNNGLAGEDPVNCATGAEMHTFFGGAWAIQDPEGLAVSKATGKAYITGTMDDLESQLFPGVIRFDPVTQTVDSMSGFGQGLGTIAIDDNTENVFLGMDDGTIQVLQPGLSDAAVDPNGNPIPQLDSGTPGPFTSLTVQPNTNRLFAMKPDEITVFSLTTGTLLGSVTGISFGGENLSASSIENFQGFSLSTSGATPLMNFWNNPNPVCTPGAPIDVAVGATVTFTPSCTDMDSSIIQEFSLTGAPALGSAIVTSDYGAIKYTAGATGGSDTVSYRVNTQDGLSVTKQQQVNVIAPQASAGTPVVRETANLQLDSGDVYVKVPGSNEFVKLTKDMLIPVGTIIDATAGKAHLTMANKDGSTYDGVFWDGVFQVLQGSGNFPVTTMKLRNDMVGKTVSPRLKAADVSGAFKAYAARKKGKKKNGLWGNAKGKYKTSGKGGSAAVRGTIWYVADYSNGTLFRVKRGKVLVDPKRGKNFTLSAGKQKFIWNKP